MSKSWTITRAQSMNRIATHPGEVLLEEFMQPMGLSARALGAALAVPHNRISALVKGQRGVSGDTALRLAQYFGTSAEFWMNLQSAYDLSVARKESGEEIGRIAAAG